MLFFVGFFLGPFFFWNSISDKNRVEPSRDEESPVRGAERIIPVGKEDRRRRAPLPKTSPAESAEASARAGGATGRRSARTTPVISGVSAKGRQAGCYGVKTEEDPTVIFQSEQGYQRPGQK